MHDARLEGGFACVSLLRRDRPKGLQWNIC
jgi:hypothetical protein